MEKDSWQSLNLVVILALWVLIISCNRKTFLHLEEGVEKKITFNCNGDNLVFESNSIQTDMDIAMTKCICEEQRTIRNSGQIISILENTDDFFFGNILSVKCDSFIGDEIFKILLSKATNHDCYESGHGAFFPYSNKYINSMRKMIASIDRLTYSEFCERLGERAPKEIEDAYFNSIDDMCESQKIQNQYFLDSLSRYHSEGKVKLW